MLVSLSIGSVGLVLIISAIFAGEGKIRVVLNILGGVFLLGYSVSTGNFIFIVFSLIFTGLSFFEMLKKKSK